MGKKKKESRIGELSSPQENEHLALNYVDTITSLTECITESTYRAS